MKIPAESKSSAGIFEHREKGMNIIGYIRSDFPEKFGIPRQSGLVDTPARLEFVPPYNQPEAVRGLEDFSHLWLIWQFSENLPEAGKASKWAATVRPPRLGGNTRKGVFATRSPFRPNPIGLSCVRLERIEYGESGAPILHLLGADMLDGTPVYDVKPYLPYADCHPEATEGFTEETRDYRLQVEIPQQMLEKVPKAQQSLLIDLLAQDPRPSYQHDPTRIYGMSYGGLEVKFTVDGQKLRVTEIFAKAL